MHNTVKNLIYIEDLIKSKVNDDNVPKIIENCELDSGDKVTIKFGKDLAWATVVTP